MASSPANERRNAGKNRLMDIFMARQCRSRGAAILVGAGGSTLGMAWHWNIWADNHPLCWRREPAEIVRGISLARSSALRFASFIALVPVCVEAWWIDKNVVWRAETSVPEAKHG
ncbi:hypothetical protein BD779DRAFT_1470314 [Infundibulicybe gibba]|nr:hypothetical protein BD779DRAFT_1470314 [Infundibulicybe gibba]